MSFTNAPEDTKAVGPTRATEGCMGEQASLEFDLTFGDVLLHKLKKITKIFTPFFKSNIFGVKMKNLK